MFRKPSGFLKVFERLGEKDDRPLLDMSVADGMSFTDEDFGSPSNSPRSRPRAQSTPSDADADDSPSLLFSETSTPATSNVDGNHSMLSSALLSPAPESGAVADTSTAAAPATSTRPWPSRANASKTFSSPARQQHFAEVQVDSSKIAKAVTQQGNTHETAAPKSEELIPAVVSVASKGLTPAVTAIQNEDKAGNSNVIRYDDHPHIHDPNHNHHSQTKASPVARAASNLVGAAVSRSYSDSSAPLASPPVANRRTTKFFPRRSPTKASHLSSPAAGSSREMATNSTIAVARNRQSTSSEDVDPSAAGAQHMEATVTQIAEAEDTDAFAQFTFEQVVPVLSSKGENHLEDALTPEEKPVVDDALAQKKQSSPNISTENVVLTDPVSPSSESKHATDRGTTETTEGPAMLSPKESQPTELEGLDNLGNDSPEEEACMGNSISDLDRAAHESKERKYRRSSRLNESVRKTSETINRATKKERISKDRGGRKKPHVEDGGSDDCVDMLVGAVVDSDKCYTMEDEVRQLLGLAQPKGLGKEFVKEASRLNNRSVEEEVRAMLGLGRDVVAIKSTANDEGLAGRSSTLTDSAPKKERGPNSDLSSAELGQTNRVGGQVASPRKRDRPNIGKNMSERNLFETSNGELGRSSDHEALVPGCQILLHEKVDTPIKHVMKNSLSEASNKNEHVNNPNRKGSRIEGGRVKKSPRRKRNAVETLPPPTETTWRRTRSVLNDQEYGGDILTNKDCEPNHENLHKTILKCQSPNAEKLASESITLSPSSPKVNARLQRVRSIDGNELSPTSPGRNSGRLDHGDSAIETAGLNTMDKGRLSTGRRLSLRGSAGSPRTRSRRRIYLDYSTFAAASPDQQPKISAQLALAYAPEIRMGEDDNEVARETIRTTVGETGDETGSPKKELIHIAEVNTLANNSLSTLDVPRRLIAGPTHEPLQDSGVIELLSACSSGPIPGDWADENEMSPISAKISPAPNLSRADPQLITNARALSHVVGSTQTSPRSGIDGLSYHTTNLSLGIEEVPFVTMFGDITSRAERDTKAQADSPMSTIRSPELGRLFQSTKVPRVDQMAITALGSPGAMQAAEVFSVLSFKLAESNLRLTEAKIDISTLEKQVQLLRTRLVELNQTSSISSIQKCLLVREPSLAGAKDN